MIQDFWWEGRVKSNNFWKYLGNYDFQILFPNKGENITFFFLRSDGD